MIIEARDVFHLADVSAEGLCKDEMEERFEGVKFYVGSLKQIEKKFKSGIYVLWYGGYSNYLIAKQYFLKNKKTFFHGFDDQLDEAPWFIMASMKEFKDVKKWIDEQ